MKSEKQVESELQIRQSNKKRLELSIQKKELELEKVNEGDVIQVLDLKDQINILRHTWVMNEGAIDAIEIILSD